MHRPAMACDTESPALRDISWLPKPLAEALAPVCQVTDNSAGHDLSEQWRDCVVDWLRTIRRSIGDYDDSTCSSAAGDLSHLVGVVTNEQTALSEGAADGIAHNTLDSGPVHIRNAFDAILGDLGNEIFELDVYQRQLSGNQGGIQVSILNIFDACLDEMKELLPRQEDEIRDWQGNTIDSIGNISILSDDVFGDTKKCSRSESTSDFYSWSRGETDRGSTRSRKSDINLIFDDGSGVPVPPKRRNRRSASISTIYDNMDNCPRKHRPTSKVEQLNACFADDSDTESTCWSYRACSSDSGNRSDDSDYQTVWMCNSGFHKSDAIIYNVIRQNSTIGDARSFRDHSDAAAGARCENERGPVCEDKKRICPPVPAARRPESQYANIDSSTNRVLTHVESESQRCHCCCRERQRRASLRPCSPARADCESHCDSGSVEMKAVPDNNSLEKDILFPDYGPVKDALCDGSEHPYESLSADGYSSHTSCQENVYEEIRDLYSSIEFSVDGDRTLSSVEVETCESECEDDIPVYENLRDNSAYAISADVIAWKHSLWDPFGMEDEEDEWITGEDALVFSREHRPPYVIPRARVAKPNLPTPSSNKNDAVCSLNTGSQQSLREVRRMFEHGSPDLHKDTSESPPANRFNQRLGGSNEMLSKRRSTVIHSASASGSGDSLDSRGELDMANNKSGRSKSLFNPNNLTLALKANLPTKVLPSLFEPTNASLMEGTLQRAKIVEHGKKVKKSWSQSYAVLMRTALAFYKDQKAYQQAKSSATPTSASAPDTVPLCDAVVAQCMPQHTSRYLRSFSLTSGSRDQILLQTDTPANSVAWYEATLNAINKLPSDYECPNYSDIHIDDPSATTPSPTSKYKRPKNKGDSSNEDLSDTAEYSNVRSKLRKFFTKRPTMESLVKKGIYKDEPVFGRCLEEVCSPRSLRVPDFVVRCVRAIEASQDNMETDGLYRASGNLSQVQKIRLEVDQNKLDILDSGVDVHVLTGSLKLFFRELKEPLIPTKLFDQILTASMNKNRTAMINEFREIVNSLPLCNRDTLKFLLEHLLRVTSHSSHNRMSCGNLAIVFGPTLLWAPAHLAHNLAADSFRQNLVVEILLNHMRDIFDDHPVTAAHHPVTAAHHPVTAAHHP